MAGVAWGGGENSTPREEFVPCWRMEGGLGWRQPVGTRSAFLGTRGPVRGFSPKLPSSWLSLSLGRHLIRPLVLTMSSGFPPLHARACAHTHGPTPISRLTSSSSHAPPGGLLCGLQAPFLPLFLAIQPLIPHGTQMGGLVTSHPSNSQCP